MCNFVVGQNVVLVDDKTRNQGVSSKACGAAFPLKGQVYTIRAIVFDSDTAEPLLLLDELDNRSVSAKLGFVKELGFSADRFRPVVTKKTDISIFKEMLHKHKADA